MKDKYILLDFWASWDKASMAAQDSLVNVQKALKKEKFLIVSLSLDLDKKEWLKACDKDTTRWKQVCDFKMCIRDRYSILQSDRSMGICSGIQHNTVIIKPYLMNLIYHLPLHVRLIILNLNIVISTFQICQIVFK